MQSEPDIRVVNTPQAARYLNLSESILNKLRLTGGGPTFIKLGRRVLYQISDLDAWISRHRRTSTSDLGDSCHDR